jgi:hypothetical protein
MFTVELELMLEKGQTWPDYALNLEQISSTETGHTKLVTHKGYIASEIILDYNFKGQGETVIENGTIVRDQNIEIINIWINEIKIQSSMFSKLAFFMPRYRDDFIEYCNKTSTHIDYGPIAISKLWHAGVWSMPLPTNFWEYYQGRRDSDNNNDFEGNNREEIRSNLKILRELLNV